LKAALESLKPDYRAVILLHYYEGFSVREIASLLGLTVTAVTTRLQRGREALKKFLTEN
ncbi:MAG: RNA polymerase sigma factor, partial [Oscillospiraceae bacterium]|nr:RNA polymerase sigma factor [Oscillospiraceae bacterium]